LKLSDTEDIADFIVKNYGSAKKIVEVGVGAYPWVAKIVKECLSNIIVVVTDVDGDKLASVRDVCPELVLASNNILKPQLKVYDGADLIYSLRPPTELVSEIFNLALRVGCDILIRPYSHEEGGYDYPKRLGWKYVSYRKAALYWLKRDS